MRFVPLLAVLVACDAASDTTPEGSEADAAPTCTTSELIAQCPPGSNPVLGERAEADCIAAIGGVVQDGEGQATGQCYGVASCRVVCQFAVPCRCGVESVSRDGVICAPCEGAASCGNGVCEGGEGPDNCPIDCGAVCNAGERRCDGEVLQECNLQGRFDTLPCPMGEVCEVIEEVARCIRDPDLIEGDAGVGGSSGDGGLPPEDGRLIPGDGTWPAIQAPPPIPPLPREAEGRWLTLSSLELLNRILGSIERYRWLEGDRLQGISGLASVIWGADAQVESYTVGEYPPADVETFCAAWLACRPGDTPEQCAGFFEQYAAEPHGTWQRDCIAAVAPEDCRVIIGGQIGTCLPQERRVHPVEVQIRPSRLAGGILVAPVPRQTHLVALNLDDGTVQAQETIGEYLLQTEHVALSVDARRAVAPVNGGGSDRGLLVWDRMENERAIVLPRAQGEYFDVALSPDGQVLALAAGQTGERTLDAGVSLWNLAEEKRIVTILGTSGRKVLGFSPDGRDLAVDVGGRIIEIWRLGQVPEKLQTLELETGVDEWAYAPDATTLALYESIRGLLSLWNTRDGQRWWSMEVGRAFYPLNFSADGRHLIAGGLLAVDIGP